MQNGFYQATGAMVTQLNRLNTISNNLANLNTAGFKRDDVVIGDFKRLYEEQMTNTPIPDHTKSAAKYLNQTINRVPRITSEFTDFSAGAIRASGNALDMAITRDDVFFMVRGSDGNVSFSKDGKFSLDDEGFIVNKRGERLCTSEYFAGPETDGIRLQADAQIQIDRDGWVLADGEPVGKIFAARVSDLRQLKKIGDNQFRLDDLTQVADLPASGAIRSGFVEQSNVQPVSEMVGLIETHRLVEMYQKVMTCHMDDLNNDAINKLASVK